MKFPESYAVYDTETTGLDTNTCEVIELAVKRVRRGYPPETFSWLIRPERPVPENITEITGITNAMLEEKGFDPREAWTQFAAIVGTLPLIGHNILRYDNPILCRYWRAYCIEVAPMPAIEKCVDTAALYKASRMNAEQLWHEDHFDFAERVLDSRVYGIKYNLTAAAQGLGVDVSGIQAHRAAGDVEMCDRVYRRLVQPANPVRTPAEEAFMRGGMMPAPIVPSAMPSGSFQVEVQGTGNGAIAGGALGADPGTMPPPRPIPRGSEF